MIATAFKNIDSSAIEKDITIIENNLKIIDHQIKDITTKHNEIQNFTSLLEKKNNLYNSESNVQLKLQSALLNNEKDHITHMKKIFMTNMFNELFDLSNNIILLISSFLNLDFKENSNTSEILKKLVRIKHLSVIKMNDICDSINAITKNITLVYETLIEFNEYTESMKQKIEDNNYHCLNIYTSLKHKHNYIMLEYIKYYNTLNNIIPYYKNLSVKINKQLSEKAVLFHCLNNNIIESSSPLPTISDTTSYSSSDDNSPSPYKTTLRIPNINVDDIEENDDKVIKMSMDLLKKKDKKNKKKVSINENNESNMQKLNNNKKLQKQKTISKDEAKAKKADGKKELKETAEEKKPELKKKSSLKSIVNKVMLAKNLSKDSAAAEPKSETSPVL